jgi:hypothetical protein
VNTISSTGPRVATDTIIDGLLANPDGATVYPSGQPYRGAGIVVGVPEYSRTIAPTPNLRDDVRSWVDSVADAVTAATGPFQPRRAFGAWYFMGRLYLDVVELYRREDEDLAVKAGHERNQIAVWDAGRCVEIPTGGTGE